MKPSSVRFGILKKQKAITNCISDNNKKPGSIPGFFYGLIPDNKPELTLKQGRKFKLKEFKKMRIKLYYRPFPIKDLFPVRGGRKSAEGALPLRRPIGFSWNALGVLARIFWGFYQVECHKLGHEIPQCGRKRTLIANDI